MHQLFAVLLSFLFAFCHHLSHTSQPEHTAAVRAAAILPAPVVILPDRYQLARYVQMGR